MLASSRFFVVDMIHAISHVMITASEKTHLKNVFVSTHLLHPEKRGFREEPFGLGRVSMVESVSHAYRVPGHCFGIFKESLGQARDKREDEKGGLCDLS